MSYLVSSRKLKFELLVAFVRLSKVLSFCNDPLSLQHSLPYLAHNNVIFEIKFLENIILKNNFSYQLSQLAVKLFAQDFFVSFALQSSAAYSKLERFCGQQQLNTEFATVKLGVLNCPIQILLQIHNVQRIIFRIFSQSTKVGN